MARTISRTSGTHEEWFTPVESEVLRQTLERMMVTRGLTVTDLGRTGLITKQRAQQLLNPEPEIGKRGEPLPTGPRSDQSLFRIEDAIDAATTAKGGVEPCDPDEWREIRFAHLMNPPVPSAHRRADSGRMVQNHHEKLA